MHCRGLFTLLVVATSLVGCSVGSDTDTDEDDLGETAEAESIAPDNGWRGMQKVGAFITCDGEDLFLLPDGKTKVKHDGGDTITKKGRPVLVQKYPGVVKGTDKKKYVWIDPDFWGIGRYDDAETDEETTKAKSAAQNELVDRFGTLNGKPRVTTDDVRAAVFANRRGWFPLDCLKEAKGDDKLPSVSRLKDHWRNGRKINVHYARNYIAECLVDDPDHNKNIGYQKQDTGHITKYWSYGSYFNGGSGVYLTYNTPSAMKDASSVGGGGFTQMYVPTGDPFYVFDGQEKRDGFLAGEPGYTPEGLDGTWSYGFYKLKVNGGSERVYGWVYSKCLRNPPAAVAAFKSESCAGKDTNRVYCVDASPTLPGYTCDASGQLTKLTCSSPGRCEFHPNGGGEAAACTEWSN